jgi:hypothetical protein
MGYPIYEIIFIRAPFLKEFFLKPGIYFAPAGADKVLGYYWQGVALHYISCPYGAELKTQE